MADSRVLCLGDAFVELVCERPAADAFVPRLGGAVATVAAAAARAGAPVAVAGGAGDDSWGRWLRARLADAGADTGQFALLPGVRTPLALSTLDGSGVPTRTLYGDSPGFFAPALAERLEAAVADAAGLVLGSATLADPDARELTMGLRELALEAGRPLVFHPGLRLEGWRSQADAAASANACVPGALLVSAELGEATIMTGEEDPERAALALVKAGARLVVLGLGADGAMLRGELRADVEVALPAPGRLGAAEAFTGALLARLALSNFYPPAVAAGLRDAVATASAAARG